MGEIVRTLKWRLDLDAEAFATGLEKAATGAEKLAAAGAKVAATAPGGLEKTAAAAKSADTALEGLDYAMQQVVRLVQSLEKGAGSPLVLKRNSEQAAAAFNVLAASAQKAGIAIPEAFGARVTAAIGKATTQAAAMNAELEKMGGQTPTKLDKVITALDKTAQSAQGAASSLQSSSGAMATFGQSASTSATKTGAALGVLKDQTNGVAKGVMAASGAVGPFGEILEKLGVSGEGATSKLGGLSLKGLAVVAAFKVGYDTGTKLNKMIQDHGNYLEKAIDATVKFATSTGDTSARVRGLAADIDLDNKALTEHTRALAGASVARRALLNEVDKTAKAFESALPGWTDTIQAQKRLKDEIDAVATKFKSFSSTGQDLRKEVEANRDEFAKFVAKLEAAKVPIESLPPSLQKAIDILKSLGTASSEAATGITDLKTALESIGSGTAAASIDAVATALARIRAEGGDVGAVVASNAVAFQKLRDEAEKDGAALQKFRQDVMDQIPAYQATALAAGDYQKSIDDINAAWERAASARRAANEADIQAAATFAQFTEQAGQAVYAIDSIGEAWARATGQAAGFTVEVRRATKQVEETDPAFTAFIESLAATSDEYERMIPWVGALIAQLEKGNITGAEFQRQIEAWRTGFMQIQGMSGQMFGDIDTLFNKLNHQLNEFTRGSKGGGNPFAPKPRG